MKKLVTALLGLLIFGLGSAVADDKEAKLTTYTVTMTGVT